MSKWQGFPFCSAPFLTSAEELNNRYPVPFTAAQIMAALDRNTWDFRFTAVRGITDAQVEIAGAMALLNLGTIAALGIAIAPILSSANGRTGIIGTMTRREDPEKCIGTRFIYNYNLCYVEIHLGDIRRKQLGSTTLYYPRITIIYYGDKCVWANELRFIQNANEATGGVDVVGSSGAISTIYASTGDLPPLEPIFFGEIRGNEDIDQMDFTPRSGPAGTDVTVTGITFAPITDALFGDKPGVLVSQAADNKTVVCRSPAGAIPDYITLKGGDFRYETRVPFQPV